MKKIVFSFLILATLADASLQDRQLWFPESCGPLIHRLSQRPLFAPATPEEKFEILSAIVKNLRAVDSSEPTVVIDEELLYDWMITQENQGASLLSMATALHYIVPRVIHEARSKLPRIFTYDTLRVFRTDTRRWVSIEGTYQSIQLPTEHFFPTQH